MIEKFNSIEPYSLNKTEKEELLLNELKERLEFHYNNCIEYRRYLDSIGYSADSCKTLLDLPFIPVRLFKEINLKSIPDKDVFKVMTSSGTTNQVSSKIYLNKENAILQQKILLHLLGNFVGKKRLPMLVIDTKEVIRNRSFFSARGATIIGLEFAASRMVFALDENMEFDYSVVKDFLEKYGDKPFLVFGFTFMVWKHLFDEIEKNGYDFDFSNGYLLTGGGWKKLKDQAVSRESFKKRGNEICGLKRYVDHYSMAEQSGSIFCECECGHLHASIYSDIITRRFEDFSPCDIGEKGIIQVLSVVPHSYPGNSLLTEDVGVILGEDDCPCGRKGKYIEISGRMKSAEIRGCSDTYADKFK